MNKFIRNKKELVYDSKIVSLYKDYLTKPYGGEVVYDLVHHKTLGGAGVLLVDDKEYVYLVKQYRNTVDDINIEIPAGGYSKDGEDGKDCAVREAEEETGYIPLELYHVTNMISSVGVYDEKTDIYIGMNLKQGKINLDPDEYIEVLHIHIDEAIRMIYEGNIIDSKTIIALLAYLDMKNKKMF